MKPFSAIGKHFTLYDQEKVTGKALYTVDMKLPGMLHAKVLRSKYPHAKIAAINAEKAERLRGVKAVATGHDAPGRFGMPMKDQPCLADGVVRYIGEPVAAVAAIDEDISVEALDLIEIEYEELKPVFDPVEALKPDAPLIHKELGSYKCPPIFKPIPGTNICSYFTLRKGDVEAAFASSDYVFEGKYSSHAVQHCPMEPHAALAMIGPDGKITVWGSLQSPYGCRAQMAEALNLPMDQVRLVVPFVGGGFGAKNFGKPEPIAVALARKSGKPVKLIHSREEEFNATVTRHAAIVEMKTGVRRDGTFTALDAKIIWDNGAYADSGPTIARNAGFSVTGPYRVPSVRVDSYLVYTNKVPGGAFRGFGIPQVTWAAESQIDTIAKELGIDPLEMRLKNAYVGGDISATSECLMSVGLKETLRRAAEGVKWSASKQGNNMGRGIACMHKSTASPTASSAFVKLNEDGTVNILSSAVDMGQGSSAVLAQITAEELGIAPSMIKVAQPDTDLTPYDWATVSSRITFHAGNAVRLAAIDLKKQLIERAAARLEANPEDLSVAEGRVFVKEMPQRSIPISQLTALGYYEKGGPILGSGSFYVADIGPIDIDTAQGGKRQLAFWMYGSQGAEVEVDIETGMIRIIRLVAAHDCGTVINPVKSQGQLQGSLAMGLGTSLMEEMVFCNGAVINPDFSQYTLPTALDMPPMEVIFVEEAHPDGPFGAKGLGEPGLAPTAPAIANAVFDAIGVKINDLPLTPQKVLAALRSIRERT